VPAALRTAGSVFSDRVEGRRPPCGYDTKAQIVVIGYYVYLEHRSGGLWWLARVLHSPDRFFFTGFSAVPW